MKTLNLVMLVLLTFAPNADAKKKEPPAYDQTGTVSMTKFDADYHASMTVNGETFYAHCNADDHSISCTNVAGVWEAKLADGRTMVLADRAFNFKSQTWVYNPLAAELLASGAKSETFSYRIATLKFMGTKGTYLCVPYGKDQEACYEIS